MIEKLQISLWDLFVYFFSGIILIFSILIHLYLSDSHIICTFQKFYQNSEFSSLIILSAISIMLGLIFEPISNAINDIVSKTKELVVKYLHRNIFFLSNINTNWSTEIEERYKKEVINSIPTVLKNKAEPYHWAKDYLIQKNIPGPYITFLSKYGFYRNLGFILYINAFIMVFLYELNMQNIFIIILLIVIAIFSRYRSEKFYNHLTSSVYRHYLINIHTAT